MPLIGLILFTGPWLQGGRDWYHLKVLDLRIMYTKYEHCTWLDKSFMQD